VTTPLVSVVIPTRNRVADLGTALGSLAAQTYSRWEAIVIDDASDVPIPADWPDPRIRVLRVAAHGGVAAARNRGFDAAQGDFVCLLDDDDFYLPEKLSTQVKFLLDRPDLDLVFSKVRVIYPDGVSLFCLPDDYVHDPVRNLASFNAIHTNSALWRRVVSDRVRFDERLTRFTDTQFFIAAALSFPASYLPVEVAVWNRGTHDQITKPDLVSCRGNLKLLISIFETELLRWPAIHARYLERLEEIETELLRLSFGCT
jgi:glycosyltransferase involved in cell wall biosynthesis